MEQVQIRRIAQCVAHAGWPVADQYLKRTQGEYTAAEQAIVVSRFQGAAIDYLIRGSKEQASRYLQQAAAIKAALSVLHEHEALFATHCAVPDFTLSRDLLGGGGNDEKVAAFINRRLLSPRSVESALESFAKGMLRAGSEFKKSPKNRGFFYCLGARFVGEAPPTADEAMALYNALEDAVIRIAPEEKLQSSYGLPEDGSTIRTAIKAGQRGK